jgi:hypothetical protein
MTTGISLEAYPPQPQAISVSRRLCDSWICGRTLEKRIERVSLPSLTLPPPRGFLPNTSYPLHTSAWAARSTFLRAGGRVVRRACGVLCFCFGVAFGGGFACASSPLDVGDTNMSRRLSSDCFKIDRGLDLLDLFTP